MKNKNCDHLHYQMMMRRKKQMKKLIDFILTIIIVTLIIIGLINYIKLINRSEKELLQQKSYSENCEYWYETYMNEQKEYPKNY